MQYNVDIVLFSQWNKNVINAKIKCGKKSVVFSEEHICLTKDIKPSIHKHLLYSSIHTSVLTCACAF